MNTELHIGNVSSETTEAELHELFSQQGPVSDINVVTDRSRGNPRRFAFVTMATTAGALAAIEALNGQVLGGRFITVNEAKSREDRPERALERSSSPHRSSRKLY
jgi:RNA recognition motif-containing protein